MRYALKHVLSFAVALLVFTGTAVAQHDADINQDTNDSAYLKQVDVTGGSTADIDQEAPGKHFVGGLSGTDNFVSNSSILEVQQVSTVGGNGSRLRGFQKGNGGHLISIYQETIGASRAVADIRQNGDGHTVDGVNGRGNSMQGSDLTIFQDGTGHTLRFEQFNVANSQINLTQLGSSSMSRVIQQ